MALEVGSRLGPFTYTAKIGDTLRPTLAALSIVVVAVQSEPVAAQVVLPTPAEHVVVDPVRAQDDLPVSLDRIKRALDEPLSAGERSRWLNLTEYVVVIGEAPELSLFGGNDLNGGPMGSMHADMMAVARPSRVDQAVGSDALGAATTAAFFKFVPPAIRAIAGWFSGNEDDRSVGWAAYTETFVLESSAAAQTLMFYCLEGQRVALHASLSHLDTSGFMVAVDGQEWDTFDRAVSDRTIPNELLLPGRVGNLHSLTVRQVRRTALEAPLTIDVLVVVHESW